MRAVSDHVNRSRVACPVRRELSELYFYLADISRSSRSKGRECSRSGSVTARSARLLASRAAEYHGLDLAEAPLVMMRDRLSWLGSTERSEAVRGSALSIPWADGAFDIVVTIGCLHHTGDLQRSVDELYRVLRPGGAALVMLYNRNSFRQLVHRAKHLRATGSASMQSNLRAIYDANAAGEAAPHTDYVSRAQARKLFDAFAAVSVEAQNFEHLRRSVQATSRDPKSSFRRFTGSACSGMSRAFWDSTCTSALASRNRRWADRAAVSDSSCCVTIGRRTRETYSSISTRFGNVSRHHVSLVNPMSMRWPSLGSTLGGFDAVIVHYTVVANLDNYLHPRLREKIGAYDGVSQFLQDEYRWVNEVTATTRELGVDLRTHSCRERGPHDLRGQTARY